MSFDINWELLKDGIEANQLQKYLNSRFESIKRPNFLGPVEVIHFDFGDIPPEITILNITDPLDDFYYLDSDDLKESSDSETDLPASDTESYQRDSNNFKEPNYNDSYSEYNSQSDQMPYSNNFNNQSASNTKKRDNFNLSNQPDYVSIPPSYPSSYPPSYHGSIGTPKSQPDTSDLFNSDTYETIERTESDAQLDLSIVYNGNMRMSISTSLIVNQPTPGFMVLPLTLTLTKSSLKATAVIAYLSKVNMINFCLKTPSPGDPILKDLNIDTAIGDGNRSVLKNVGKIESFIVHTLSAFLNDYVVFPNYHSIYLDLQKE
ncbi:hypothetical protein BC833DRAFT_590191 [Globomyces pollinis-pini]|nr:hypothetical protein BC833DRAFT_590191 [Globomyces pollinis-pini]